MFTDNKTFATSFNCSLLSPRWGLPWSRERHLPGTLSKYDGGHWFLPPSSKFLSAISNLTFLTYPSSLGYTCTTLPSGHLLRVLSLSLEMTISPTARFLLGWTHFCLTCNILKILSPPSQPEFICKILNSSPTSTTIHIGSLKLSWGR